MQYLSTTWFSTIQCYGSTSAQEDRDRIATYMYLSSSSSHHTTKNEKRQHGISICTTLYSAFSYLLLTIAVSMLTKLFVEWKVQMDEKV